MQRKRRLSPEEIDAALTRALTLYNIRPNAVYEAALAYSGIGWPVIPSPLAGEGESVGKNPVLDGWQNLRITTVEQVQQHFQGQMVNVGVPTGTISGLIDFNLECEDAINLAKECLLPTGTVFGHASAPSSHWFYRCIEVTPKPTREFRDPLADEELILELRGDGGYQTILPASLHVLSGEWVEWSMQPPQQPACITYIELHKCAVRLATRVMLARHCPGATKPDEIDPLVRQRLEFWQRLQEEVEGAPAAAFEQTQRFLNALDDRTDQFTFQTFDDNRDRKDRTLARVLHGTLAERYPQLLRLSQAGAGIFVTINATDFKGRKSENITGVRSYYADLDGAPLENTKNLHLLPHIITETSPGRFGVYYLIADAPLNAEKFKATQQRLAQLLESDPSVCDLPRVARLPGFPHQKELRSSPFMTRIVSLSERKVYSDQDFQHAMVQASMLRDPPVSRSYMRNEAAHLQGHVGPHKQAKAVLDDKTQTAPKRLLDGAAAGKPPVDLSKGYEEGKRNIECARVAGSILGKGGSEEEALAQCLEWNKGNKPPLSDQEVRDVVRSIAKSERRKHTHTNETTQQPRTVRKIRDGEASIDPPPMLVQRILPAEGLTIIGGQAKAGKTFIAINLAVALAARLTFLGYRVREQVGVYYISAEGFGGIAKRVAAAKIDAGLKGPIPLTWADHIPNLQAEDAIKTLIAEIYDENKHMQQQFGVRLGVLILDTVAASFTMQDENSNAEVNKICSIMHRIGNEAGVLMVAIHHLGKDAESGLRGASAWEGSADVIISALANINPNTGVVKDRRLALAKTRDYEPGPIAPYTLEVVKLGVDKYNDDITTCIVKIDTQPRLPPIEGEKSKSKKAFVEACRYALQKHEDFRLKEGVRHRAVELKYIREEFEARYVTGESDQEKRKRAIRSAWARTLRHLPEGWRTEKDPDGDEWLLL
jgi:hypothetical protein